MTGSGDRDEEFMVPPEALDPAKLKPYASTEMPIPKEIDISFFSHKSRKSTRLVGNNSDEMSLKARHEWLSFDLNQPIYVTSIIVFATGYEDYHEMEVSILNNLTGEKKEYPAKYDGQAFRFQIGQFLVGFGLRPTERWFKDSRINKIDVSGVEQGDFVEVVRLYDKVGSEIARAEKKLAGYVEAAKKSYVDIEENRNAISEQEDSISVLETKKSNLVNEVKELADEEMKIRKKIEIGTSVERENNERVAAIELNIKKISDQRTEISELVSAKEKILRDLENNINLFPTEIAGYVKQGTSNIRLYFALSILPMIVVSVITVRLIINAENILDVFGKYPNVGIFDLLVSRVPYVVISGLILTICYTLLNRLFSEIFNINRRRQDLFKVSIIATDTSYASQDGMDLTNEQIYNLRTQTKMELLKEHLKQHMGEDFVYMPKQSYLSRLSAIASQNILGDPSEVEKSVEIKKL